VSFVDWNGLDPGDVFTSEIEAANDFAVYYNGTSIVRDIEFGSSMYTNPDGTFSYNIAYIGNEKSTNHNMAIPDNTYHVGLLHTHGGENLKYEPHKFSDGDKNNANSTGLDSYLVTPAGKIFKYDVITQSTAIPLGASNEVPSDSYTRPIWERNNDVPAIDTKPIYIDVDINTILPSFSEKKDKLLL